MICLLKNKENEKLLDDLTKIVGSEDAAYYLLCANNGYELDQTPFGEDSALYAELVRIFGTKEKAIMVKAQAYLPSMGNWQEHPEQATANGITLDKLGEPLSKHLIKGTDVNGAVEFTGVYDAQDVSNILGDQGRLNQVFDFLRDNNVVDREYVIAEAISGSRNQFVRNYVEELSKHGPITPVTKYMASQAARAVWDERTKEKIVNQIQERLAEAFHLKKIQKGFGLYFESDDDSELGKLRVRIVNSISAYVKNAPEDAKGAYVEDQNHLMSMLYISLKNGDHTTIIHELLHRYVRLFWDTQPVQDALKVVEKRKIKGNSVAIEEALVQKLTDMLNSNAKENKKFWTKINNMFNKLFSVYSNKHEILDDLLAYFSINKDISDLRAETVFFEKFYVPVFQTQSTEKEKDILNSIKTGVKIRIKASTHEKFRNNATIADLRMMDQQFENLDSENTEDVKSAIYKILNACRDEMNDITIVMGNIEINGIENLDVEQFYNLCTNTLGFYTNILHNVISYVFDKNSNEPDFKPSSPLHLYYNSVITSMDLVLDNANRIKRKWTEWYIDKSGDELVTFADKEIWKYNAKLWADEDDRIGGGNLGSLNKVFGAINSESPIINLIDHLVRRMRNHIEPIVQERGHELVEKFDKYTNHIDIVPLTNQFRDLCEHDSKGRLTGNFRRSENWGEMQNLIDDGKLKIAKRLGIEDAFDEDLRLDWRALTDDQYKAYYDAIDDFFEKNDIIRQYKPDYYRTQRKYLSKETIEFRKELREQINLLETKCKNQKTGVVETFKLKSDELQKLQSLKKQLQNLANPYNIVQDEKGKIISIEEKDPDSKEGKMAHELIMFKNAVRGKVIYQPNYEAYNKDLKALRDSGASDQNIMQWKRHNTIKSYREDTFTSGGSRTDELALLYAQKQAIINSAKQSQGYYMPDLDLLNEDAWILLKEIDQDIADLEKEILEAGGTLPGGDVNQNAAVSKMLVSHYDNGQPTSDTQLDVMYTRYVRQLSSIYPEEQLKQEFWDKYFYTSYKKNASGEFEPFMVPLTAFYTMLVQNPAFIVEEYPTGKYTKPSGFFVEEDFDSNNQSYIQPKPNGKWHDAKFVNLYNTNKKYKELYDLFIQTMGEIYQNYGMNDINKYQLPGIRDDGNRTFFRRGFFSVRNMQEMFGINETDDEYNEQLNKRPDGTTMYVIPLRWVRKLKNPNMTSTDLIRTVTMMYESSLQYKEKSEILPKIWMLKHTSFFSSTNKEQSDQESFINRYVEQFIYGRNKTSRLFTYKGKQYGSQALAKISGVIMNKTHSKLMAHKWKVVMKNAWDSFWNFMKEMSGGKYFTVIDTIAGGGYIMKDLIQLWKRNVGVTNVQTLSAAIMQRNGLAGSTKELFKGQRSSALRRFIAKHFNMGEYTLVDYMTKGLIAMSVYHNHRLILNPLTGKKEFLNKWQAAYVYSKAGMSENKGIAEWNAAGNLFKKGVTMLNAVYVDKRGNLKIKPEYEDIVRPNGSNLLETRIETIIRERSSVINGTLDDLDKPYFMTTIMGAMIGQMRGWMFSQSADHYKMGHQFKIAHADLEKFGFDSKVIKGDFEDENLKGIANLSSGFVESGDMRGMLKAYGRCMTCIFWINKMFNIKKPTMQQKYQVRSLTVSFASIAAVIALGILFGKRVEDDPDDIYANFLYATNTGVLSERISQLYLGVIISMLELIRSVVVAKSYYDDIGSVYDAIINATQWYQYENGIINTRPYMKKVKRGTYAGEREWFKNTMKASSILIPEYSPANVWNNFSVGAYESTDRFYNNQFPVNMMNYIPQNKKSEKSNIVTDMFNSDNRPY